jgi:membrane associated rhomboid family serine protease
MRLAYYGAPPQYQFNPGLMTPVVKALILVNVGVFIVSALIPPVASLLIEIFGFTPQKVLTRFMLWQPFTYLFLHDSRGISHILFNMLILWMFGVQLERLWGSKFFLRYYLIAGCGAAVVTLIASLLPLSFNAATYTTVTIGASGAIYGLLMAFAMNYPDTPILMFFLFPVPAKYFVMILGTIAFISAPRYGDGIGHITHLGGLLAGYLYLRGLRRISSRRFRVNRLDLMAHIKYRYVKWKIGRLRKTFNVSPEKNDQDWNKRIH